MALHLLRSLEVKPFYLLTALIENWVHLLRIQIKATHNHTISSISCSSGVSSSNNSTTSSSNNIFFIGHKGRNTITSTAITATTTIATTIITTTLMQYQAESLMALDFKRVSCTLFCFRWPGPVEHVPQWMTIYASLIKSRSGGGICAERNYLWCR